MKFYIVTPAYNALHWLQGCVRSVADQVGGDVEVHHHVQDGGSADGTAAWLERWQQEHAGQPGYKLTYESVRDDGLYAAINTAWKKLPDDADITSHLNSDEQYLPGALAAVAERFTIKPYADMAVASYMVLDKEYRYICHRRTSRPTHVCSRIICQMMTCATFHRAASFRAHGVLFDASYRSLADVVFFRDILATSPRIIRMSDVFSSVYVVTGNNVSWSSLTREDKERIHGALPRWLVRLCPAIVKWNNLQHYLADFICKRPQGYAVYTSPGAQKRTERRIKRPLLRWGYRTTGEA